MTLADEPSPRDTPDRVFRRSLRHPEHLRWYDLMRIILTWAAWRRPRTEQPGLWAAAEASQAEQDARAEVQTMAQTAVEAWIEEGMSKGLEKGRTEGRAEGLLHARAMLRALLENRFGPLTEAMAERISTVENLDKLQAAFEQALRLTDVKDLQLQLPLSREVQTMAQTAVEAWIEEGMAKGLEQGDLRTARSMLRRLLERRFGELPQSLVERIDATNDLARLETAFEQAIQLVNLTDLHL